MGTFKRAKLVCLSLVLSTASAISLAAQTVTTIASIGGSSGFNPLGLVQGANGNFYGTTIFGGSHSAYDDGTVFEVTPAGVVTTLHTFFCSNVKCPDGGGPDIGLLLSANGNFYGLTTLGGAGGQGTVFEITPTGKLTTLYSFCALANCADGASPSALLQGTDGNFYGTTAIGGNHGAFGTVFKLTPAGELTTLHNFCPSGDGTDCPDGRNPTAGSGFIQASNGNFYGTTYEGGANGYAGGTIFEITPAGMLTTLYSFCAQASCADGASPNGLLQAANGNFYGVTYAGGAVGEACGGNGCGTIYEMTPTGQLTTLHAFCELPGCPTGPGPVIQATDGNFYGTSIGGAHDKGTAFESDPSGSLTTLYNFCRQASCADGQDPYTGMLQATNGTFYGTTATGGAYFGGTVFSLSMGLGPFVKTLPAAGKVRAKVLILGNNLTGTSSVSFNGTPAVFTVVSDTAIKASVPTGATSGTVQVVTPSGTLSSNVRFRLTQ